MALTSTYFQANGGLLSALENADIDVRERQVIWLFDDETKELVGCKVGKIIPSATGTTPFSEVPTDYVFSEAEKVRLAQLMTNAGLLAQLNDELGTDLQSILATSGLTYSSIATILDNGTGSDRWRNAAVSIYGNAADADGDLCLPDGSVPTSAVYQLQSNLDGKADVAHGHEIDQITGLSTILTALDTDKVETSSVGVLIAELDETGVLKAEQVPSGITAPVSSVHGRTGAVVAASGDYDAADVTADATGTLSAGTVADQLAALEENKVPIGAGDKIDTVYLPTAVVTYTRRTVILLATANVQINPVPAAYQIWNGSISVCTPAIDTTRVTKVFLQSVISTGGPAGSKLRLAYRTGGWSSTVGDWTQLTGGDFGFASGDGAGVREGAKITLPGGAIGTDVYFTVLSGGGDGATNGTVGRIGIVFEEEVPLGPGSQTGAQIVTAVNAELGSTAWQSGSGSLSDGSVTLAKIVNFATQTAPLRKSAGTGVLEVGTQSDWRTFLDVANTFNGRKGTVVPASGDYTADQITETSGPTGRVFVTDALRQAMTRWNTSTTFTTSDIIGFNEAWVTFGGTGTLTLTGTLTNGAVAFFINIFNDRTVPVNLVPQSSRTMRKADGTALTTYSLPAKTGLCAKLEGTAWVLQV